MRLEIGLLLALGINTASASIVTTTFGPDDSFTTFVGYRIGSGSSGVSPLETAVEFIPTADEVLTQIRVGVFPFSATKGDGDLVVNLSQGTVPGTPIETFSSTVGTQASIYAFTSVLQPELLAGQSYWIVLSSNDLVDNDFGWGIANVPSYSQLGDRVAGHTSWDLFYNVAPAFEVSGQPVVEASTVPEPATKLLVSSSLMFGILFLKGRRKFVESSSWSTKYRLHRDPAISAG